MPVPSQPGLAYLVRDQGFNVTFSFQFFPDVSLHVFLTSRGFQFQPLVVDSSLTAVRKPQRPGRQGKEGRRWRYADKGRNEDGWMVLRGLFRYEVNTARWVFLRAAAWRHPSAGVPL